MELKCDRSTLPVPPLHSKSSLKSSTRRSFKTSTISASVRRLLEMFLEKSLPVTPSALAVEMINRDSACSRVFLPITVFVF